MDEKALKKINRRLSAMRSVLWLIFIINLATLALFGFLAFKVVTMASKVSNDLDSVKNTSNEIQNNTDKLCNTGNTGLDNLSDNFCQ